MPVHFIGIGGISMSGLAQVLLGAGFPVSGSDSHLSELTEKLSAMGARIFTPQAASNIPEDTALVVYTAAIHPDNPEYAEAVRRGIPMETRAEFLGHLMANYPQAAAVAGTHGKTTTTSMVTEILLRTDCDPTISVGGILPTIGGNIHVGGGQTFLTEACEYTNSFLSFYPTHAVILNIEADHLDFFKNLDHIRRSFRAFAEEVPADGVLVLSDGVRDLEDFAEGLPCRVITAGLSPACDVYAADIAYDDDGCPSFTLFRKGGECLGHVTLSVPGEHNIRNAAAAAALADSLGASAEAICEGLAAYRGTKRRFEHKGTFAGAQIVDDYAHHPQEITATLSAAARVPHARLICAFQPHTYSRTKALLPGFIEALSAADEVLLVPIYAARETDTLGVSSEDIAKGLRERGVASRSFSSFEEIEAYLRKILIHGDLLITMGAGDVYLVGERLLADTAVHQSTTSSASR